MENEPQRIVRDVLRSRRRVTAKELIDLGVTWDVRKIISRLRRQGDPIETEYRPGVDPYATYIWTERQERLL